MLHEASPNHHRWVPPAAMGLREATPMNLWSINNPINCGQGKKGHRSPGCGRPGLKGKPVFFVCFSLLLLGGCWSSIFCACCCACCRCRAACSFCSSRCGCSCCRGSATAWGSTSGGGSAPWRSPGGQARVKALCSRQGQVRVETLCSRQGQAGVKALGTRALPMTTLSLRVFVLARRCLCMQTLLGLRLLLWLLLLLLQLLLASLRGLTHFQRRGRGGWGSPAP